MPNTYSFNVTNFTQISQEVNDRTVSCQKSIGSKARENSRKANRSRKGQFSNAIGLEIIKEEL